MQKLIRFFFICENIDGPISKQKILGKVSYRIWPRRRAHVKDDFCFMNRNRPIPLSEDEMFGKKYNVYKIPFTK